MTSSWVTQACVRMSQDGCLNWDGGSLKPSALSFMNEGQQMIAVGRGRGRYKQMVESPRSKCLSVSWLQSPSAVTLELKKIESVTVFIVPNLFAMK